MNKKWAWTGAFLLLAAAAWAQTQGRISGLVTDADGNPIDKAEVKIVSQRSSSIHYELKTGKDGRFVQVGVAPGYYMVTSQKTGFLPASKELHVGVAGEATFEGRMRSADAATEKSISEADKQFLKGNSLYGSGKFAEAAELYREALKLDASSWRAHLNLGLALKKLNSADEALAEFRKSAELNPESYSANKETGESLGKAGKFAEAKPFYEKAVSLSPDDPDAHYNLGVCLLNTGESEPALAQFKRTIELKPDYADAYYQAATLLIGQNQVPEAVADLEKFLELAPNHEKAPVARQILQALKK